jgi:hypothetical protein
MTSCQALGKTEEEKEALPQVPDRQIQRQLKNVFANLL